MSKVLQKTTSDSPWLSSFMRVQCLLCESGCRLAIHTVNVHRDTVTMRPTRSQLRIQAALLLPVQTETGSQLLAASR